jgi:hypothetical protein
MNNQVSAVRSSWYLSALAKPPPAACDAIAPIIAKAYPDKGRHEAEKAEET